LSPQKPPIQLSESAIRAVYAAGEESVVGLVMQLMEQVNQLTLQVKVLEEQQSKNSRNSSKPPSGDGFGKRTQSLRQKSQRSSGGQVDHPGQTLEWRDSVDEVVVSAVEQCQSCGADLRGEPIEQVSARQVHDLPPIHLQVTEYRAEAKTCPHCQQLNQAAFPVEVTRSVQYGSRLKGMLVYLMNYQLLPSKRTRELLNDLLGVQLSEGTLYNSLAECFEALEPFESILHDRLRSADVAHFDETGFRVNQHLWWLHVACTAQFTAYSVQRKRGTDGMNAMGILPEFQGKAIHDGLKSYESYPCAHFLCNAHHLRELQFVWERYQQPWAVQMRVFLSTMHHQVKEAKQQRLTALDAQQLQNCETRYHAILAQGLAENPPPPIDPNAPPKRGRPKQSIPKNLLDRLQNQQEAVLGFICDFDIPFDNNQAERDIRMVKLKQKISGCFRTEDGAHSFARIRSFLTTLKKQSISLLDSLALLLAGIAHPQDFFPE
jgi:transposase